jgi:hypothetical protein
LWPPWLPVNPRGQDALHSGRQPELRKRTRNLHPAVAHQRTFVEQRLQDLLDEERISSGAVGDHLFELIEFGAVA